MTMDPIDPNLPPNHPVEPNVRQPVPESRGMGWGIPLVIAAFALIFGLMFYNFSSDRTTTASVDAPRTMTQTDLSTPPAPPATPPVKTQ